MTNGNPNYMSNIEAQIRAFKEEFGPQSRKERSMTDNLYSREDLINEMVDLGEKLLKGANEILVTLDGRALGRKKMDKTVHWLRGYRRWDEIRKGLDDLDEAEEEEEFETFDLVNLETEEEFETFDLVDPETGEVTVMPSTSNPLTLEQLIRLNNPEEEGLINDE